jgi:glucose-6-phosphate 1-dehydrogenase
VRRAKWAQFVDHLSYLAIDATGDGKGWSELKAALDPDPDKIRLFYLALPPSIYGSVCDAIGQHGLNTPRSRIVEKADRARLPLGAPKDQ